MPQQSRQSIVYRKKTRQIFDEYEFRTQKCVAEQGTSKTAGLTNRY